MFCYAGRAHVTGGRDNAARGENGRLELQLARPGSIAASPNPEQLLAASWCGCFIGAIAHLAARWQVILPGKRAVDPKSAAALRGATARRSLSFALRTLSVCSRRLLDVTDQIVAHPHNGALRLREFVARQAGGSH